MSRAPCETRLAVTSANESTTETSLTATSRTSRSTTPPDAPTPIANTGNAPGADGTGVDAAPSLTSTMPTDSPAAARSVIAVTAPPRSDPRPLPVSASSDGTSRSASEIAKTRRSKSPSSNGRSRPATSWRARWRRVSMPCASGSWMLRESSTTMATARPVAAAAGTSLTGRSRISATTTRVMTRRATSSAHRGADTGPRRSVDRQREQQDGHPAQGPGPGGWCVREPDVQCQRDSGRRLNDW